VYRWFVIGHSGGMEVAGGPRARLHEDQLWPPNSSYFKGVFRTGPERPSGGIEVPALVFPENCATLDTLNPTMLWDVDARMPLVFMVQFSTTPAFAGGMLLGTPPPVGDYSKQFQSNRPYLDVENILRDCTKFYWRVIPGIGEGGSGGSREWGAPSETGSFYVNLGQCPTPTPTPTRLPATTPMLVPTLTPTPIPVVCQGLNQQQCLQYPQQCTWVPQFTMPGAGYCRDK